MQQMFAPFHRQTLENLTMKSVIEELCCGDKFQTDTFLNGKKEKELLRRGIELEDAYSQNMSREERAKFIDFSDARGSLQAEEIMQAYVKGIKLGILIGIESAETVPDK